MPRVFVNRLNRKMRLQSDPTIIYGIVGGKGSLGRSLTRADIEQPTPYNTYTIDGLPPGPIANPGRASLEAVANPSRTKDLYFVADGTGGHVFAETYEQHLKNVARWRDFQRDQKESAADCVAPQTPPANRCRRKQTPTFKAATCEERRRAPKEEPRRKKIRRREEESRRQVRRRPGQE